ncbi:hypothetical protein CAI16_07710 [Virgibacillus dokdonensis]|uniref:DUF1819 domain-containing protein n=1 Tax=Virgibacillus dokdonensis TaxID=302167 RepID=A0A3E0WRC6_9BACI|nr:hypothetical protein [Virgibacillus dokdonensis]RFA35520.1 hypothetical protein CAI16_07710 [Virgibacillus dokdonensis]
MSKPVGFDQKVLLNHLDYTANQTKKHSRKEMYTVLDNYLRDDITGVKSRKNAITMLMKIWYRVDDELKPIRDEILEEFSQLTNEERLLVHWGLTIAAYPFFKDVSNEFGRLFQLQDEVSSKAINNRMKEAYGDRRRVEVATSAVLGSMKAWNIIQPVSKSIYTISEKIIITSSLIQSFFVQILLNVLDSDALHVDLIENHPLFFPFNCELNITELRERKSFSFYRQGVKDLVIERNPI